MNVDVGVVYIDVGIVRKLFMNSLLVYLLFTSSLYGYKYRSSNEDTRILKCPQR